MVLDREKLLREKPRAPKAAITVREGDDRRDVVLGSDPLAIRLSRAGTEHGFDIRASRAEVHEVANIVTKSAPGTRRNRRTTIMGNLVESRFSKDGESSQVGYRPQG